MNSRGLGSSNTRHLLSTLGMTPQGSTALLRDPQSLRDPQTWPFHPLRDACILLRTPGTAPPILLWPFHPVRDPQTWLLHLLGDQGPPFPHRSPEMAPPIPSGPLCPLRDPTDHPSIPSGTLCPLRDPPDHPSIPSGTPTPSPPLPAST